MTAYNKSFECSRIRELAAMYHDLSEHLLNIKDNIVDLNEGDSVYFDSLHKHSMIALNGKPVKFLDVLNNNGGIE